MSTAVDAARLLLAFAPTTPLTKNTLRVHFRTAVKKGHSDRGGDQDVQSLCAARDLLQSFLKRNEKGSCIECSPTSLCAYHRVFPV
jgi:hypothetical protein